MSTQPVVFTNKARCRDCYRCLRQCPVKAIRLSNGQASVVPELCIACGTCVRECPQGAKQYRRDVEGVARLIKSGRPVAASVAPSAAADLQDWEMARLPAALRRLGFAYVGQTATGAWHVARQTADIVTDGGPRTDICTACPAVVGFVAEYRPAMADRLLPVASPMVAHARLVRRDHPEMAVVFIGPCVAKKLEADRSDGAVEAALTFAELRDWLKEEKITFETLEESEFDDTPAGAAALFPLPGGLLETGHMETGPGAPNVLAASGVTEIEDAIESLAEGTENIVVEALFCPHGCINGPGMSARSRLIERRRNVMSWARRHHDNEQGIGPVAAATMAEFRASPAPLADVTEEEIRRIFEETGKAAEEDRLNCGSCGYASCRDKAIAVARGMAEKEMCLPHMRRLAEKRTDKIIDTSPNGIVIVDEHLNITHMNPAFRKFFMCSDAVLGRRISYLMDPEPFDRLVAGSQEVIVETGRHSNYNLVCHEIFYALREDRQYVGIFVNITQTQADRNKLNALRAQTMAQARELLDHQVAMAQNMARFLGENTAHGETLVRNLLKLVDDSTGERKEGVD